VIKQELKNALSQSMWDTRISDATRVAQGMKPRGAFGEVGPAGPLSGFRTLSQQAGIPSQYTKVKNPSRSYHTWGMAADVVPDRLPGETQKQYDYRVGEVNREIAKNINDPVVEWGGDWKFVDPAHFQYGSGSAQKSAKLYGSNVDQAGVRPATMVAVGPDAPSRTAYSGQIVRPQQVTSGVGSLQSAVNPAQAVGSVQTADVVDTPDVGIPASVGVPATVIPSKYNYPVKPDGTPYTAEDIANLPPEVQKAHYEALMAERMGRVPYNLTEEQRQKMAVAKGVGRVINYSPITRGFVGITKLAGAGLGALPGAVGEFGEGLAEAGRQIGSPGEAVEDYETASPLKQVQMEVLAGRPNRIPGTSFARAGEQYAGGIPVQELGGKSDPHSRTSSRTSYSPSGGPVSAASDTGRSQQYYLWDLGVGIPSPGEPEYNDYQEYLRSRRTTA
jgi:hypothetical protein